MWASLGLMGLLAGVLLGGAWLAFRLMEEGERIERVIATLPPKTDDDEPCDTADYDWSWDDRRWVLVEDDEPKWSGS